MSLIKDIRARFEHQDISCLRTPGIHAIATDLNCFMKHVTIVQNVVLQQREISTCSVWHHLRDTSYRCLESTCSSRRVVDANGMGRTPIWAISIVRTAPRRYTTRIGASPTTMAVAVVPANIKAGPGGLIGGAALNPEWETEVLLRSTISRVASVVVRRFLRVFSCVGLLRNLHAEQRTAINYGVMCFLFTRLHA